MKVLSALENYYSPHNNVLSQRILFNAIRQNENETLEQYANRIKDQAILCDFKEQIYDLLRDRFIFGLTNDNLKKILVEKGENLRFEDAYNLASQISNDELSLTISHEVLTVNVTVTTSVPETSQPCAGVKQIEIKEEKFLVPALPVPGSSTTLRKIVKEENSPDSYEIVNSSEEKCRVLPSPVLENSTTRPEDIENIQMPLPILKQEDRPNSLVMVNSSAPEPKPPTPSVSPQSTTPMLDHTPQSKVNGADSITKTATVDYEIGSFVMLKGDIRSGRLNAPNWKIDSASLFQKFTRRIEDGVAVYRSTAVYSGWSTSAQEQYKKVNVAMQTKSANQKEIIIRLKENLFCNTGSSNTRRQYGLKRKFK